MSTTTKPAICGRCAHDVYLHDDLDGGTHECNYPGCHCEQFKDATHCRVCRRPLFRGEQHQALCWGCVREGQVRMNHLLWLGRLVEPWRRHGLG